MVFSEIAYGDAFAVTISPWRPSGYFRIGVRAISDGTEKEYLAWTARLVPDWIASAYLGIPVEITYTDEVDQALAAMGMKAWIVDALGLEEYVAV